MAITVWRSTRSTGRPIPRSDAIDSVDTRSAKLGGAVASTSTSSPMHAGRSSATTSRYRKPFQLLLSRGPGLRARSPASVEDEQVDVPTVDLGGEPVGMDVVGLALEVDVGDR